MPPLAVSKALPPGQIELATGVTDAVGSGFTVTNLVVAAVQLFALETVTE